MTLQCQCPKWQRVMWIPGSRQATPLGVSELHSDSRYPPLRPFPPVSTLCFLLFKPPSPASPPQPATSRTARRLAAAHIDGVPRLTGSVGGVSSQAVTSAHPSRQVLLFLLSAAATRSLPLRAVPCLLQLPVGFVPETLL
ncbi:hypothetical protein ACER0C_024976 [Sarotherodon galilaeus]